MATATEDALPGGTNDTESRFLTGRQTHQRRRRHDLIPRHTRRSLLTLWSLQAHGSHRSLQSLRTRSPSRASRPSCTGIPLRSLCTRRSGWSLWSRGARRPTGPLSG